MHGRQQNLPGHLSSPVSTQRPVARRNITVPTRFGPGCSRQWALIHPSAFWTCGQAGHHRRVSAQSSQSPDQPASTPDGTAGVPETAAVSVVDTNAAVASSLSNFAAGQEAVVPLSVVPPAPDASSAPPARYVSSSGTSIAANSSAEPAPLSIAESPAASTLSSGEGGAPGLTAPAVGPPALLASQDGQLSANALLEQVARQVPRAADAGSQGTGAVPLSQVAEQPSAAQLPPAPATQQGVGAEPSAPAGQKAASAAAHQETGTDPGRQVPPAPTAQQGAGTTPPASATQQAVAHLPPTSPLQQGPPASLTVPPPAAAAVAVHASPAPQLAAAPVPVVTAKQPSVPQPLDAVRPQQQQQQQQQQGVRSLSGQELPKPPTVVTPPLMPPNVPPAAGPHLSDWFNLLLLPTLRQFQERGLELWQFLGGAVEAAARQLDRTWFKVLFLVAFVSGLVNLALAVVVVPLLNWELVPKWNQQVSTMVERRVTLGRVHEISLIGATGLVPLVRVGPVSVGPAPLERSRLSAAGIKVYLDPITSLVNGQAVLKAHVDGLDAHVVQRPNFSWSGYPEDTTPSSRDFVPGLWRETDWESVPADDLPGGYHQGPQRQQQQLEQQQQQREQQTQQGSHDDSSSAPSATRTSSEEAQQQQKQQQPQDQRLSDKGGRPPPPLASMHASSVLLPSFHPGPSHTGPAHTAAAAPSAEAGDRWPGCGTAASLPAWLPPAAQRAAADVDRAAEAWVERLASYDLSQLVPPGLLAMKGGGGGGAQRSDFQHNMTAASRAGVQAARHEPVGAVPADGAGLAGRGILDERRASCAMASTSGRLVDTSAVSTNRPAHSLAGRTQSSRSTSRSASRPARPAGGTVVASVTAQPAGSSSRCGVDPAGLAVSRNVVDGSSGEQDPMDNEVADEAATAAAAEDGLPPVALGAISVRGAKICTYILGERLPRRFENVDADLQLGKGYSFLDLQVDGDAHERDPRSNKITLMSPHAKRHLRHVTPGANAAIGGASSELKYACDNLPDDMLVEMRRVPPTIDSPLHPLGKTSSSLPIAVLSDAAVASPSKAMPGDKGTDRQQRGVSQSGKQSKSDSHHGGTPSAGTADVSPGAGGTDSGRDVPPVETFPRRAGYPATGLQADGRPKYFAEYSELLRPVRKVGQEFPPPAAAASSLAAGETSAGQPSLSSRPSSARESRSGSASEDPGAYVLMRTYGVVQEVVPEVSATPRDADAEGTGDRKAESQEPKPEGEQTSVEKLQKPTGGHIRVRLVARGVGVPNHWPDMTVSVKGEALHAPLVERLVELPMDVSAGRVAGEFRMRAYDTASWGFPEFYGNLKCRGIDLHFWDSPDDLLKTNMDLVFERNRMYLHGAQGYFGAIPLGVTGDMDMNPETGTYRLSATVPGVEVNALRATLAVRPVPVPITACLRGVMHLTGPLEKPVFSGSAVAVRPTPAILAGGEQTPAREVMLSTPGAIGGYDRIPLAAASGVFTLDTATEMFSLHSAQVQPVGGGQVSGSGRLWVAPQAEQDPRAITTQFEGAGLDADRLAAFYLPKDAVLPPAVHLGKAHVAGTFAGSHMAPRIRARFDAPTASLSGSVELGPESMAATAKAPAMSVDGRMLISLPDGERVRNANTQAEASLYSKPRFEGCDVRASVQSVDLLPLATDTTPTDPLSNGQPLRAKVSGAVDLSLRPANAARSSQLGSSVRAGAAGTNGASRKASRVDNILPGALFEGPVSLSNVRINQLELVNKLSGTAAISDRKAALRTSGASGGVGAHAAATPLALRGVVPPSASKGEALDLEVAVSNLVELLNLDGVAAQAAAALAGDNADAQDSHFVLRHHGAHGPLLVASEVYNGGSELHMQIENLQLDDLEVGSFRGRLAAAQLDADMDARQGRAALTLERPRYASVQAASVTGSLRWEGDIVKLEETVLQQDNSRYEFSGEVFLPDILPPSLSKHVQTPAPEAAAAVVPSSSPALQRAVNGRAEVGGSAASGGGESGGGGEDDFTPWEPVLGGGGFAGPGGAKHAEASGAKHALETTAGADTEAEVAAGAAGRWRLQVSVPSAQLEDLLSAVQTLSAGGKPGRIYSVAKTQFLETLVASGSLEAQDLRTQVDALPSQPTERPTLAASGHPTARSKALPGLQDLHGNWSGKMQLYGGPTGASNIDFDLRGRDWRWGSSYSLDGLVAAGSVDSAEGVQVDELSLKTGDARLLLQGNLLCPRQDASLEVSDFPLALLQPLYSALPALSSAAVAAEARGMRPGSYFAPLTGLSKRFEATLQNLGLKATSGDPVVPLANLPASPLVGQLFASGHLGGSTRIPEAWLNVRIEDGAIGATSLAHAKASFAVDTKQRVSLDVDLAPLALPGHLRLSGGAVLPSSISAHFQPGGSEGGKGASDAPATSEEEGGGAGGLPEAAAAVSGPGAARAEQCDVQLNIKDGGMALLSALVPECEWQSGTAGVDVRVHGDLLAPRVEGAAHFARGTIFSPMLKYPVSNLEGNINFDGSKMATKGVAARIGKTGVFRLQGELPVVSPPATIQLRQGGAQLMEELQSMVRQAGRQAAAVIGGPLPAGSEGITLDLENVELRVRNMYTGSMDAKLSVRQSTSAPVLGGWLRFSKGTAYLLPPQQQTPGPPGTSPGGQASTMAEAGGAATKHNGNGDVPSTESSRDLVAQAFAMLKAGRKRATINAMQHVQGTSTEAESAASADGMSNLELAGLEIRLGPDLRAVFPVVLNMGLSGQVSLNGKADPAHLSANGAVRLDGGTLNLVASQFHLDREHANRIVLTPETGLDPAIDVVLVSGDLRAVIQGRASNWQDSLVLTASGTKVGGTGGGTAGATASVAAATSAGGRGKSVPPPPDIFGAVEPSEVARIFEERLAEALLGDNGQLALRSLASSTFESLLPKIETHGQLGRARWRLVGAPSLPSLLSLDPVADPQKFLSSLALGTEVEVQFGKSLQAALVHKLQETDMGTEVTLKLQLSRNVRLQAHISRYMPTILLQYSSEGVPEMTSLVPDS